jgi:glycosyltransferase involved in cell wall biosynthesis
VRVLLVTEFFPDESSTGITGGVEARCFYLQRHLEADHDVQVLARFTDGTRWDFADIRSVPRRLAFLVGVVRKGLRAEADIVDASNVLVFPAAWVIARIKRKPIVFWYPDVLIGDWRSGMFGAGLIGEAVERIALRLPVQGYIAISEATARKLIAHGISKDQISVVPCGFEPSIVASAVAEPPPKTHTVCVVSRLVPYKRVDLVLDAVARLVPEHPDISLLVIGRGPEKDRLVDQAAGLGIADRVTFLGYVPSHQDVIRHIASAEIYVSASEIEGFGISVVEAMAVGTPYVVSRIDAFHEVTHGGQGGLLFAPGDGGELAARISELLSDPDRSAAKAADARTTSAGYTWERVASMTLDVYRRVSQQGGGRRRRRFRIPRGASSENGSDKEFVGVRKL